MIIDFIIEDLLLDSYLQKNFHTPYKVPALERLRLLFSIQDRKSVV